MICEISVHIFCLFVSCYCQLFARGECDDLKGNMIDNMNNFEEINPFCPQSSEVRVGAGDVTGGKIMSVCVYNTICIHANHTCTEVTYHSSCIQYNFQND